MRKLPFLAALFALALSLAPDSARSQGCGASNPNCIVPTAPASANNNQAASTAFVVRAIGGLGAIIGLTGDGTATGPGSVPFTLATVNSNVGSFGSATQCVSLTVNAKGLITAASAATCTPAFSSLTGSASAAQIASSPASHAVPIDVAGTPTWTVIPNCLDSVGQHINYTQSSDAWSCGTSTSASPGVGSVDNLLPNVQQQLWTGVNFITKQNVTGTASQTLISCSAFTPGSPGPSFTCSNTQQLRFNDLFITSIVPFWGFAGGGYITCSQVNCTAGNVTAARVNGVNTNVSFSAPTPGFAGISPASSSAVTITPIAPGDLGSSTNGADGWTKTSTLVATIDDWGTIAQPASTAYPGCIRPLLLRKGITGQEVYQYVVPPKLLGKYQGQTVTFGAVVYQRVGTGTAGANTTWHLFVNDNINPGGNSTEGTGTTFGAYQFLTTTHTVGQTASSAVIGISTDGNAGDVFDACLMTAAFVPSMVQSQLKQNSGEVARATSHCNPPLLTPYIINFPSTQLVAGSGLFGYNGNDLEALSLGCYHNSIGNVYAKLEWTSTTVGKNVFFGANVNTTNGLTFGLQAATQVSGVVFPTPIARVPLYHDGTVAIYTDGSGLIPTSGTFDFTDIDTTPPTSVN